jgi:hypothetical protein
VQVQPLPFTAHQLSGVFTSFIQQARTTHLSSWQPNYVVASKLGVESSALGRITASCKVAVGEEVIDIGLSLRSGAFLCIPDMAQPAPDGVHFMLQRRGPKVFFV